jgi:hypothetical protein
MDICNLRLEIIIPTNLLTRPEFCIILYFLMDALFNKDRNCR